MSLHTLVSQWQNKSPLDDSLLLQLTADNFTEYFQYMKDQNLGNTAVKNIVGLLGAVRDEIRSNLVDVLGEMQEHKMYIKVIRQKISLIEIDTPRLQVDKDLILKSQLPNQIQLLPLQSQYYLQFLFTLPLDPQRLHTLLEASHSGHIGNIIDTALGTFFDNYPFPASAQNTKITWRETEQNSILQALEEFRIQAGIEGPIHDSGLKFLFESLPIIQNKNTENSRYIDSVWVLSETSLAQVYANADIALKMFMRDVFHMNSTIDLVQLRRFFEVLSQRSKVDITSFTDQQLQFHFQNLLKDDNKKHRLITHIQEIIKADVSLEIPKRFESFGVKNEKCMPMFLDPAFRLDMLSEDSPEYIAASDFLSKFPTSSDSHAQIMPQYGAMMRYLFHKDMNGWNPIQYLQSKGILVNTEDFRTEKFRTLIITSKGGNTKLMQQSQNTIQKITTFNQSAGLLFTAFIHTLSGEEVTLLHDTITQRKCTPESISLLKRVIDAMMPYTLPLKSALLSLGTNTWEEYEDISILECMDEKLFSFSLPKVLSSLSIPKALKQIRENDIVLSDLPDGFLQGMKTLPEEIQNKLLSLGIRESKVEGVYQVVDHYGIQWEGKLKISLSGQLTYIKMQPLNQKRPIDIHKDKKLQSLSLKTLRREYEDHALNIPDQRELELFFNPQQWHTLLSEPSFGQRLWDMYQGDGSQNAEFKKYIKKTMQRFGPVWRVAAANRHFALPFMRKNSNGTKNQDLLKKVLLSKSFVEMEQTIHDARVQKSVISGSTSITGPEESMKNTMRTLYYKKLNQYKSYCEQTLQQLREVEVEVEVEEHIYQQENWNISDLEAWWYAYELNLFLLLNKVREYNIVGRKFYFHRSGEAQQNHIIMKTTQQDIAKFWSNNESIVLA